MKKLLMFILLSFLITSCGEESSEKADPCSCTTANQACIDATVCAEGEVCYATKCYSKDSSKVPCSCDPSVDICSDAIVCSEGKQCFDTACYSKDDELLGIKKLDASFDNPIKEMTSGESLELKVKVLRAATTSMSEKLEVGPVANEPVHFKINTQQELYLSSENNNSSTLKEVDVKTDERGVATAYFSGVVNKADTISVITTIANCPSMKENDCIRTFQIKINAVTTTLYLAKYNESGKTTDNVTINIPPFNTDLPERTIALGAIVETNNATPYGGQDVTFKLQSGTGPLLYNPSNSDNKSTEITVKTDQIAGLAQTYFHVPAGTENGRYEVVVTKEGTQGKLFIINLSE